MSVDALRAAVVGVALATGCGLAFPIEEAAPGASVASASGGGGGTGPGNGGAAGASAGGGAPPFECGDAGVVTPDYYIERVEPVPGIVIDGSCAEWGGVAVVPFTGESNSDNQVQCRLVWADGDPDVVLGCCDVQDDDLRATHSQPDTQNYSDDAIELLLHGDTTPERNAATTKVVINLLGVVLDLDFEPAYDDSYDAHATVGVATLGEPNDGAADRGYTIEWRQDAGFAVEAPQAILFSMGLDDLDASWTHATAFGGDINEPGDWGTAVFSCALAGD